MTHHEVLARVRNGVCAVGYLTLPLADYINTYELPGQFTVVGTGFLVRLGGHPKPAINRHRKTGN